MTTYQQAALIAADATQNTHHTGKPGTQRVADAHYAAALCHHWACIAAHNEGQEGKASSHSGISSVHMQLLRDNSEVSAGAAASVEQLRQRHLRMYGLASKHFFGSGLGLEYLQWANGSSPLYTNISALDVKGAVAAVLATKKARQSRVKAEGAA